MIKISQYKKITLGLVCSLLILAGATAVILNIFKKDNSQAVSALDFNAGRIIDDSVFYNKDSMSAQDIQNFLNRLIGDCNTWNSSSFYDGEKWVSAPYVCLNNYHENPSTGETSFEKGGGAFAGGISAAQIIYNAAQEYGINPQVLLVMLKKESLGPLTNDTWPTKRQYKYAMGYACPDSGPGGTAQCDESRAGFYKQMTLAAWQLKYYKDNIYSYNYKPYQTNYIQYSPNAVCGGKNVYIENIATASLYIYTPYTPNDGALANYPGTANCGAYGNRNFFMFFNDWFGSTYGNRWEQMSVPRIMTTNKATSKINPDTYSAVQELNSGAQIVFSSKATLSDGSTCLRTKHDTERNVNACVVMDNLSEFTPIFEDISPVESSTVLHNNKFTCKINYQNLDLTNQCFNSATKIAFSKKTIILGKEYYITSHDWNAGAKNGFLAERFEPVSSEIKPLTDEEKKQKNIKYTCKIDLNNGSLTDQCFNVDTKIQFAERTMIGGTKYLVTQHDQGKGYSTVFLEERFQISK